MTLFELLKTLQAEGIRIWGEKNKLHYSAPAGKLTPELRAELAQRKLEILALLRQDQEAVPIEKVSRDQKIQASYSQSRLWFLQYFNPDSNAYNISRTYCLAGPLRPEVLSRALDGILQRHEALRTVFMEQDGQPYQVIQAPFHLDLSTTDLRHLPEAERQAEALRQCILFAGQPFNLSQGPLLRAHLWQLDQDASLFDLTIHHINIDGWSLSLIFQELSSLYTAYLQEGSSSFSETGSLPLLPVQYADFAAWQRQRYQGEFLREQLAYWKGQLAGSPPLLPLPTDNPRAAVQSYQGSRCSFHWPAGLGQGLQAFCQQEDVTLFMLLLAAFQVLLARYSGQEDISVGAPIANRTRTELEGLVGFFVNTLVMRTDLSGRPSFRQLLKRVKEMTLAAYAHQDMPFEKLVEELNPERNPAYTPFFQVMFVFHNTPKTVFELPGLSVELLEVDYGESAFDLSLYVREEAGNLDGYVEYSTALFEASTIERLVEHFHVLLEGILRDPDLPVDRLSLLTEAERRYLLLDLNATPVDYPPISLQALFEAQVERAPERTALFYQGQAISFGELNRRANQLAHALQSLGAGPGGLVGICLERSPEMVAALLAVLKTGAAYLPLDPAYPAERLAYMVADASPRLLVTRTSRPGWLPEGASGCFCLEDEAERIASQSDENLEAQNDLDTRIYVMYTSGSTGKPKGVEGLQRGAINRLHWMWQKYPYQSGEVACQKTALSFVDSVCEILSPLLAGIPSVILPDEVVKDPYQLVEKLASHKVTRMVLVPSLLSAILDVCPDLQGRLPCLKFWVSSGESLSPELVQRFYQAQPQGNLLNLYGSSEAAGDSTWYETRPTDGQLGSHLSSIPIGRPISNTQIYILDPYLNLLPAGIPGELCIGGDGLAQGYFNHPELTAERFIANPFKNFMPAGQMGSERLYKSGDLARYRSDGVLEYLGRIDQQVKIRGVRVELGEVESVLKEHPAIHQCLVMAREDQPGEKRLVAYVVPAALSTSEKEDIEADLRSYLRSRLPEVMLPAAFVVLEAFPLTPSGKIDRRNLPGPSQAPQQKGKPSVAPRSETERRLAAIWQDVLGVRSIGVEDRFFDLGGHSLLVVKLFIRIGKEFGKDLPLASIFQTPTIAHQARLIEAVSPQEDSWTVLLQPHGSKPPFFMIHGAYGFPISLETIANAAGETQPFYTIQLPLISQSPDFYTSMEDIAVQIIQRIRGLQPHGPYFLGGYSFTGYVAYEVACQLQEMGEQVALLAIIDSYASNLPDYKRFTNPWIRFQHRVGFLKFAVRFHTKRMARLPWAEKISYVRERVMKRFRPAGQGEADLLEAVDNPYPAMLKYAHQLVEPYHLRLYPGPVTLFLATHMDNYTKRPVDYFGWELKGWKELVRGSLKTVMIPGDHGSIVLEPNVHILAERLAECIHQAQ